MRKFIYTPPIEKKYKLIFYDDFKSDINWNIWDWREPWSGVEDTHKGGVIWKKECVIKKDYGLCLMATTGITTTGERSGITSDFCGLISSHKFLIFKYGIVNITAKMPPNGFLYFPALWLYDPTGWLPETDMVELLGSSYSDPYSSSNYGSFTHIWQNDGSYLPEKYYYPDPNNTNHQIYCDISGVCKEYYWFQNINVDLSLDFHTYSIKWTQDELIWYIDNIERFRALSHIPQKEQHLVLNIGAASYTHIFTPSEIPQEMVIKDVSVYQCF